MTIIQTDCDVTLQGSRDKGLLPRQDSWIHKGGMYFLYFKSWLSRKIYSSQIEAFAFAHCAKLRMKLLAKLNISLQANSFLAHDPGFSSVLMLTLGDGYTLAVKK